MDKAEAINVVKRVVINLVGKNYAGVVEEDSVKLIRVADIQLAIEEYPGIATVPPDSAFDKMDIYVINDKVISIDMDLWYNDKQSDLTLSCKLTERMEKWIIV